LAARLRGLLTASPSEIGSIALLTIDRSQAMLRRALPPDREENPDPQASPQPSDVLAKRRSERKRRRKDLTVA
jgi:hypothetical protein